MASDVSYKASVASDLRRLDRPVARRLIERLEQTLSTHPHTGLPLGGEFHGLFKYRIGDYRIIYAKTPGGVLVLRIRHRKEAYR